MNLKLLIIIAVAVLVAGGIYAVRSDADQPAALAAIAPAEGAEQHAAEEEHDESQRTTITQEAAKAGGIEVETAAAQNIRESLPLSGRIILNPNTSAEIKARFPGVVRKVEKGVGQPVQKGEPLAFVESNDSLQTYAVTSPLSGIVVSRHASVGDAAGDEAMFTVANLDTVMAEFHVFPKDLARIRDGQTVQVQSIDGSVTADGEVSALLPLADADTQTVMAWVLLPNDDERWRPGMAVQGGAVVNEEQVAVAVVSSALQTIDDAMVVFVREGTDSYETRPVKLGRADGVRTEITEGLDAGEIYVSKNSFIVKADIGKAGAAHEH